MDILYDLIYQEFHTRYISMYMFSNGTWKICILLQLDATVKHDYLYRYKLYFLKYMTSLYTYVVSRNLF